MARKNFTLKKVSLLYCYLQTLLNTIIAAPLLHQHFLGEKREDERKREGGYYFHFERRQRRKVKHFEQAVRLLPVHLLLLGFGGFLGSGLLNSFALLGGEGERLLDLLVGDGLGALDVGGQREVAERAGLGLRAEHGRLEAGNELAVSLEEDGVRLDEVVLCHLAQAELRLLLVVADGSDGEREGRRLLVDFGEERAGRLELEVVLLLKSLLEDSGLGIADFGLHKES